MAHIFLCLQPQSIFRGLGPSPWNPVVLSGYYRLHLAVAGKQPSPQHSSRAVAGRWAAFRERNKRDPRMSFGIRHHGCAPSPANIRAGSPPGQGTPRLRGRILILTGVARTRPLFRIGTDQSLDCSQRTHLNQIRGFVVLPGVQPGHLAETVQHIRLPLVL